MKEKRVFRPEVLDFNESFIIAETDLGIVGVVAELGESGWLALNKIIPEMRVKSVPFGDNMGARRKYFGTLDFGGDELKIVAKMTRPRYLVGFSNDAVCSEEVMMGKVIQDALVGFDPEVVVEKPLGFFTEDKELGGKSWVIFSRLDFAGNGVLISASKYVGRVRERLLDNGIVSHDFNYRHLCWLKDERLGLFDIEGFRVKR